MKGVDYSIHRPGAFHLIPPEHHLANWRDDYQEMLGPMFFGEVPAFEEILRVVGEFEKHFNERSTAPSQ